MSTVKTKGISQIAIIRKIIEKWLNETPSFKAQDQNGDLIIRDTIYGFRLANIEFTYDHLIIRPQMGHWANCYKINYSDPDLHIRVKYFVNKSYAQ